MGRIDVGTLAPVNGEVFSSTRTCNFKLQGSNLTYLHLCARLALTFSFKL